MRHILVAPFVLFAACSLSPAPSSETVSSLTAIPYEQFVRQTNQAICEAIFSCCDQERIAATAHMYTDVGSCVAHGSGAGLLPAGQQYDGQAAAACLAKQQASLSQCELVRKQSNGFGECPEAFIGLLPAGADCGGFGEGVYAVGNPCAKGNVCIYSDTTSQNNCVHAEVEGAACGYQIGKYCDTGLRCSQGTCIVPRAVGAACDHDNFECDSLLCASSVCTEVPASTWVCYYDPS